MAGCPLRKVGIIDVDIALKGARQVFPGAAAIGGQDLTDAAVDTLDPAVGLRLAGRDERCWMSCSAERRSKPC